MRRICDGVTHREITVRRRSWKQVVLTGGLAVVLACAPPPVQTPAPAGKNYDLDAVIFENVLRELSAHTTRPIRVDARPIRDTGEVFMPVGHPVDLAHITEGRLRARREIAASLKVEQADATKDTQCRGVLVPLLPGTPLPRPSCPSESFRSVSIGYPTRFVPDSLSVLVVVRELSPVGSSTFGSQYVFAGGRSRTGWTFVRKGALYWVE